MNRVKILEMLLLALIVGGCSTEEPDVANVGAAGSNKISFGLTAQWTKGADIEDMTDIDNFGVYAYYTEGVTWAEATKEQLKPYFTSDVNTPFTLTPAAGGACTYSGSTRYWPVNEANRLSFITYHPLAALTRTVDETSGKAKYSYGLLSLARYNDDLVCDAQYDLTEAANGAEVKLEMEHVLLKITLKSKLKGTYAKDADFTHVEYAIEGVTIFGLYSMAELTMDGGAMAWAIDKTELTVDVSGTEGHTIYDTDVDEAVLNNTDYTEVMASKNAIFVLPQTLVQEDREVAPQLQIRLRRSVWDSKTPTDGEPTSYIIYETEKIPMPYPKDHAQEFSMGEHYSLAYEVDLDNLDLLNNPLTVESKVYGWNEATVDVKIHPNVYIC